MTREEAIAELGIASADDDDVVRRAYLRLLRHRKPETDPDGFRRLRAAYELLRGRAGDGSETAVATPAPRRVRTEESAAPPEDDVPAPVILTDAPVDPTANESLAHALAEDDLEGAARIARIRLDFVNANPTAPIALEAHLLPTLLLRLHEDGSRRRARGITRKLKRWLEMTGQETRALGSRGAAHILLLEELAALPDDFPIEISAAFARAIREDDAGPAMEAMHRFRAEQGDQASGDAHETMFRCTPNLRRAYGYLLAPSLARPSSTAKSTGQYVLMLLLGLIVLSGLVTALGERPKPPPVPEVKWDQDDQPAAKPARNLRDCVALASSVVTAAGEQGAPQVAAAAAAMVDRFPTSSCDEGIKLFALLVEQVRALPAEKKPHFAVAVERLRSSIAYDCRVPSEKMP